MDAYLRVALLLFVWFNGALADCGRLGGRGNTGGGIGGRHLAGPCRSSFPGHHMMRPFLGAAAMPMGRSILNSEVLSLLVSNASLPFEPLAYDYDALEPHIDAETMELHHDKHYRGYVTNCNAAISEANNGTAGLGGPFQTLLLTTTFLEDLTFNCGGALNHAALWRLLSPNASTAPAADGALQKAIDRDFGSTEEMIEELTAEAASVKGSGWAWLVLDYATGTLSTMTTANQDRPSSARFEPLAGIDVWEHAYYLKNQNRRGEYLKAVWNVMDFNEIEDLYEQAVNPSEEVDMAPPPEPLMTSDN